MSEFSELIKKYDKIRDYMRDFYIYGFKSRSDFTEKSARTYDNEKRRIESYMGEYMKWDYSGGKKKAFISVDCANIPVNPLYNAWKSKSFTANDMMLHFYILDILQSGPMSLNALTDALCEKSEVTFEVQTVRNKCKEYVAMGMLGKTKEGKAFIYSRNSHSLPISQELLDSIKFFQGVSPFGEIGSYILDNENQTNDLFAFKHHYIAHTLESGILFDLLSAIRQNRQVTFENHSNRTERRIFFQGLPLKILISAGTGRRYVCMYSFKRGRFTCFRLDYIKKVTLEDEIENGSDIRAKLDNNLDKVWGVGFGGVRRSEIICMKLYINEQHEQFIIDRIKREGQDGELTHLAENIYLYTKEVFDSNDMSPWIKTFIGRIIQLEGTNKMVINRFYADINRMAEMYGIENPEKGED